MIIITHWGMIRNPPPKLIAYFWRTSIASLLECFKTGYVDWDECLSWRNRATGKDVILGDFVSYPDAVPEQKTDRR